MFLSWLSDTASAATSAVGAPDTPAPSAGGTTALAPRTAPESAAAPDDVVDHASRTLAAKPSAEAPPAKPRSSPRGPAPSAVHEVGRHPVPAEKALHKDALHKDALERSTPEPLPAEGDAPLQPAKTRVGHSRGPASDRGEIARGPVPSIGGDTSPRVSSAARDVAPSPLHTTARAHRLPAPEDLTGPTVRPLGILSGCAPRTLGSVQATLRTVQLPRLPVRVIRSSVDVVAGTLEATGALRELTVRTGSLLPVTGTPATGLVTEKPQQLQAPADGQPVAGVPVDTVGQGRATPEPAAPSPGSPSGAVSTPPTTGGSAHSGSAGVTGASAVLAVLCLFLGRLWESWPQMWRSYRPPTAPA